MTRHKHYYAAFDSLLENPDDMVRLCEDFGSYGTYAEEPVFEGLGSGLPARFDAARNFLRTGGRFGRKTDDFATLVARTNYFRETYAYGEEIRAAGIEPFLHHVGFLAAARELHGRRLVVPAIVFANLLVPGQELAVHTDVPEFRGISRKTHPQWLIVAMRHSGLFEDWRVPIATGISWFHDCKGGELAFFPDGPDADPVAHRVRFNTALLLDTDTVFHGVDRVAETAAPVERLMPGMRLHFTGDRQWVLRDGEREVNRYAWEDIRFSVSWKAYCFCDEEQRERWFRHGDDLSMEFVVSRLLDDLKHRGVLAARPDEDRVLVEAIIDTYTRFPEPRLDAAG